MWALFPMCPYPASYNKKSVSVACPAMAEMMDLLHDLGRVLFQRGLQCPIINLSVYSVLDSVWKLSDMPSCKAIKYFKGMQINYFILLTEEAAVSSVGLYLDVNFERKVLSGRVDLTVEKKKAEVTHVVSLVMPLGSVYLVCSPKLEWIV